jgi:ATP-dependent Clp protease ATP-binding subunit ClpA
LFDRFTDRARKVMGLSRQAALRLRHDFIGTEHLLLALVDEGAGPAAIVLKNHGVASKAVEQAIEKIVERGPRATAGALPFTPRAKKALELSVAAASELGHHHLGTEHLLLGVVRARDGVGFQVLESLGKSVEAIERDILDLVGASAPAPSGLLDRARPLLDRLTERARVALVGASELARNAGRKTTDADDILVALLAAYRPGSEMVPASLAFTPRARCVLDLADEEACSQGHVYLDSGHLLLGILRENEARAVELTGMSARSLRQKARSQIAPT